ncbi:hypothetical protein VE04_07510 [Pseudogymnoascus sp. 24MN13]|nr:hypothetical protein VE04_07510 [Pseudogymnoascus sp. 24MN13]
MKLSIALVTLLAGALESPVPASEGGYNADGSSTNCRAVQGIAGSGPDDFDRLLNVPDPVGPALNPLLGGARLPGVVNARDADFAPVDILRTRDTDDSAAVEIPGKNLVDDIIKSIDTQLSARQVQDLTQIADGLSSSLGLGNIGDDGLLSGLTGKRALSAGKTLVDDINKSIGTQLNARQVQDIALLIVVDIVSMLGLEENGNDEPAAGVPSKPDLSPTEIMANARKALSAAESAYMKYPNEITRDAYNKAIETVQALTKSGN